MTDDTLQQILLGVSLLANMATIYSVFVHKSSIRQKVKHLESTVYQSNSSGDINTKTPGIKFIENNGAGTVSIDRSQFHVKSNEDKRETLNSLEYINTKLSGFTVMIKQTEDDYIGKVYEGATLLVDTLEYPLPTKISCITQLDTLMRKKLAKQLQEELNK